MNDWFQNNSMIFIEEPVQAKTLVPIGWFLGSTKNHNARELREILNELLPQDHQIDLRFQVVKLRSGEQTTTNTPKALHIYAGYESCKNTLRLLKKYIKLKIRTATHWAK